MSQKGELAISGYLRDFSSKRIHTLGLYGIHPANHQRLRPCSDVTSALIAIGLNLSLQNESMPMILLIIYANDRITGRTEAMLS